MVVLLFKLGCLKDDASYCPPAARCETPFLIS